MVNGVVYLSKNYVSCLIIVLFLFVSLITCKICFYGSMFGLNKQKVIPFNSITRLEKIDKKLVINVVNSKNIRKVCLILTSYILYSFVFIFVIIIHQLIFSFL